MGTDEHMMKHNGPMLGGGGVTVICLLKPTVKIGPWAFPFAGAHASLLIQNASVAARCAVLMLVFSYRTEMEPIWHGWLTVSVSPLTPAP